jgi:hypothetical protein
MITLLIVLGLIYARARDPQTWRWLAHDAQAGADERELIPAEKPEADQKEPSKPKETIVAGPTDLDPEEADAAKKLFAAVSDKARLDVAEMPAYWRLLKWARAQSFDELAKRAQRNVLYTQLWEQPDRYRGQPLRLRLHIKRVVQWEKVASNPAGVDHVYEVWGWTEDSKSYPYCAVVSELPPGMQVGDDIAAEGVFVGYFLKFMTYEAFEKTRVAPLLLGRLRSLDRPASRTGSSGNDLWYWLAGGALLILVSVRLWMGLSRRKRQLPTDRPGAGDATFEDWLTQPPTTEPPSGGATTPGGTTA